VASLLSLCADSSTAATTTYTGVYAGGTISSGATVLLNDGASVTGNVTDNGTLQFNQSSGNTLTISNTISGTGTLSLTNTGTLNLTGTSAAANTVVLDMTTSASSGLLWIRSGTGDLWVGGSGTGALSMSGGSVTNSNGYLGYYARSVGTATVSSGTWASSNYLFIGRGGSGTLNVTGGNVTNGVCWLGFDAGSVGTATVSSGTWANSGYLVVGNSGTGALSMSGGSVTNIDGYLGFNARSVGTATVSSGTWANYREIQIGNSGTGTLNVTGGSVTNTDGYLGKNAGSFGTVTVSSGTWANSRNLIVGSSGTGTLTMTGGLVIVSGSLSKNAASTINLNAGGTLQIGTGSTSGVLLGGTGSVVNNGAIVFNRSDASTYSGVISGNGAVTKQGAGTLTLSGNNSYTGGTTIGDGVLALGSANTVGTSGTITFGGGTLQYSASNTTDYSSRFSTSASQAYEIDTNGQNVTLASPLTSSGGTLTKSGTGTLTLSGNNSYTGGTTINGGVLQIGDGGTTGFIAGSVFNNASLIFNRSDATTYLASAISGTGTIQNAGTGTTTLTGQTSYTVPLVATAGRLIVGSTASMNGFSTTGSLAAASGATLELKSKGLAYINGLSTLTGGTIRAANGIFLSAGPNIGVIGTGVVSGFVSATRGSRIEADGGKLVVGDSNSYIGFDSDGLLYTNANEVELLDRNLAVLGALTQLGDGSAGGTLRAANGMLLEQGKNLVGRGTVYGNFVNQGDVYGDGSTTGQEIVFAAGSTVSGNGSFTNALFQGTYSPGNSPAITSLQDGGFAQSSILLMEVGGTQAGSQYDQVQDASTLSLRGGSLNVVLTNSFVPAPGNSFQILRYGQLSGDFGAVNLPAFDNGLGWQRLTTGTAMTLVAAPSAVNIDVAAGSKTLAAAGYSSLEYATSLNKSGAGALILNGPNALTGPTTIQQGTVQLADSSALATSTISPLAGGVLSLAPYLQATVGGLNPNAGGLVDVRTGMVTVANGLTPTALVTALQSGRAGGSWTGSSGITSSAAASALASTTLRSVGWLENDNGSVMFGYAATGDTNLDWVIDILDVANFIGSGKFNSGLTTTWAEGDFNYDGYADILDMADFVSTGLFDTGNYNTPAGSIAAVPEPSTLGLAGVAVGVAGLMAMRRKRAG
jgi:autotransporter-associated beta strand protein/T5SS/PEP-CTERM-associated repeat protein